MDVIDSLDYILQNNKISETGVRNIYKLFSKDNINLLHTLTKYSETDKNNLAKIKKCMEKLAPTVASDFCDYLMTIDETKKIISSKPGILNNLILAHTNYIKSLFNLTYDEKYFKNRIIVGFVHYIYKISTVIYIGSYGYYNTLIASAVMTCCKKNDLTDEESISILYSVQKIISIDIALVIEAYYQKSIDDTYKMERDSFNRLITLAEYRDEDTGNHILRMSTFAKIISKKLGMNEIEQENILNAAPMHDVGKVGIPDKILLKPGKLTKEEFKIMKSHSIIGYEILKDSESSILREGAIIALSHHENFDGSGYPDGLKGKKIPLNGSICKIADVFDALISKRIYKQAYPLDKTIEIMKNEMGPGRAFDPDCFNAFMKGLDEIIQIKNINR
ncbi:HD domain-containing phosphohydrolase [Candidatus Acidulodesulfobacterium sp. H_13]|uniref:HD domain-containing phosphohydrolase n=1 Tax=Candidatus Acidulodesulfobacterium sp. H_13 TaxID=3395470 RepID=UPI003AF9DA54